MAIFHLNAKVISRGKGQSAIAAAAYRSGDRLRDEQADEQKFYTSRAQRIEFTDIMAPKDAPEWAHDRNQLWNEAERAEKRKDAQLAREIEISLPHELTDQQREWLVKDFAREAFVRRGYGVDIAIHAPDKDSDDRNHHAHLMVTMRTLGPEGFAATKDRSLNSKAQLGEWREQWAHLANRHLERHGHEARIDHRSLKEQAVDREPTIHLGYAVNEMSARGAQSDRMDMQVGIIERNGVRGDIKAVDRELRVLEKTEAEQTKVLAPGVAQVMAPSVVSIEDIHARHAAAEAENSRTKGMGQLAQADKHDKLKPPSEAEIAFGESSREQAKEIRQDRSEGYQAAAQEAWSDRRDAHVEGRTKTTLTHQALKVEDKVTGFLTGLGDFLSDFLAGSAAPAPARDVDMKTLVDDRAAAKEHRLAQTAARDQRKADEKALDRIREDMDAGRSLKPEDVKSLTREHQEQVRMFGDDAMRQLVDDSRKRAEVHWKGRGRERDE